MDLFVDEALFAITAEQASSGTVGIEIHDGWRYLQVKIHTGDSMTTRTMPWKVLK